MENNNVRTYEIISLMSKPHYRLCASCQANDVSTDSELYRVQAGIISPLQLTLFIQHDTPVNAYLTRLTFILLQIC